MNKEIGTVVRSRRMRFPAEVVTDRLGTGSESLSRDGALRRLIFRTLKRRAGTILATTLVGTALVSVAALAVPPSYTATAQLMIEPTPAEVAASLLGPVIDTHITMLTSDDRLRRVLADGTKAADPAKDPKAGSPPFDERLRRMIASAVTAAKAALLPRTSQSAPGDKPPTEGLSALKASLLIRQERLSSIVAVSARSSDPVEAAATANRLVTLHVEDLRDRRRGDAERLRNVQEQRVDTARADLRGAEEALKALQSTQGTATPDENADLIPELKRQLALAEASLLQRKARAAQQSALPATDAGPGAAAERVRDGIDAEHEMRSLALRAERLKLRLEELQNASTLAFQQQVRQQSLEQHVASARKLLDDLMLRRQEDAKDAARPFAAEARVFTLAAPPSRPSSINPFLLIPPAAVAFCTFGIGLAVLRERMDRTLRSARDIEEAVGIPCLGLIPRPSRRLWRSARREGKAPSATPRTVALASTAEALRHFCDIRNGMQIILVATTCKEDGRRDFAQSLAGARPRTLLVEQIDWRTGLSTRAASQPEVRSDAALPVSRDPERAFDRIPAQALALDALLDRSSRTFRVLAQRYDCVILDAPPVLASMQTRLLAAKCDGVVLELVPGVTDREKAREALRVLRRTADLAAEPEINCFAVLTGLRPRAVRRQMM